METLPRGLVSTSVGAPSRLEGSARVDEGNIAKLWKGLLSYVLEGRFLQTANW